VGDHEKTKEQLLQELVEMRRREEQWRSVVANTPVFVCLVDRAGTIQYLNRTVTGIAMEDAIGRSTYDFVEPAHWEIARECIERVFDTGQTAFYESVSAGPNGSRSWYETNVGPVKVGDQVVAVTLIATDITRRKKAEELLRESEERFKLFMDNSPAIAWMKDEQGRYVYVNPSCGRRIGARPEDRIGKTDFELWPLATAEQFWKNDQQVLSSGQVVEVIEESSKPDGSQSYCRNFKFPFQDSTGRRFVGGVGIDISERKRAQEALQKAHDELEQRIKERTAELAKTNEQLAVFRKFAEASGQAFGMSYLDCKISYVNPAMLRLCGEQKIEDVLGTSFLSYYPGQLRERLETEMFSGLEHEGKWAGELTFLTAAGISKTVIASAFQILDDAGDPIYLAFVMTDITELKHAQKALERERRTLEHMLQASDHERQLIAYDIHDGLAQELAGAIMQFQVYDQFKDTKPDEAKKAYDGGVTLLRQGHIEARRLISGVRPPILDESGVVAAIAHMVHEPAFDQGPKIVFRSGVTFNRLAPVVENVIYRIAQEGLSNARNHSKSKKIVVSLTQRGERLRIKIQDWGVGFDPKKVQENRFGLDGIRERARLLGGKCNIKSKPGEGTSVVVELPVVEQRQEE
jgi:PAS domain S-box-containing protein